MDGKLRPIYFASRKINNYSAEVNYPAHRLEFLAPRLVVASKSKDYLQYYKFKVLTNSNPLSYILKKMNIDAVSQRWAAELSKFDFGVVYVTGVVLFSLIALCYCSRATPFDYINMNKLRTLYIRRHLP